MSDEEKVEEEQPQTKEYADSQDTGMMILQQLQVMNRLLGAINQNITTLLKPMQADVEMCKVTLARIKKMGPSEVTISDQRSSIPSMPSMPPGE